MSLIDNIWCEKYRPLKFDDIILDDVTRRAISNFANKGEIPHLILFGIQGIGKTSLARIIANDLLESDYEYINASNEKGIDAIRDRVITYAQRMSMNGRHKTIILDEADGLTADAQRALRGVIEEYHEITRFILTGNSKNRIIDALQSRCVAIDIRPSINEVIKRCVTILTNEKIAIQDPMSIKDLVNRFYPDIRRCINELQKHSSDGTLRLPSYSSDNIFFDDIIDKIIKIEDPIEVRKFLIENSASFNDDWNGMLKTLFNIITSTPKLNKIQRILSIVVISEHLDRAERVMDKEINAFSCIISIMKQIKTRS